MTKLKMNRKFLASNKIEIFGLDSDSFEADPIVTINEDIVFLELKLKDDNPRICPFCGSSNVVIKETISSELNGSGLVKLVDIQHDKIITDFRIILFKRKYKCKNCNKIFRQVTDVVDKHKKITNQLAWIIFDEFKKVQSFTDIAKRYNLSVTTVIDLFEKMVHVGRRALPTILCIDEIKFEVTRFNKFPCVLSDYSNRTVVDIVISRKLDFLRDYFLNFDILELQRVKVFISDMNETYRTIKKEIFPNAIHIVDRFHVVKLFTTEIKIQRNIIAKSNDINKFDREFLKKKRRLFTQKEDLINDRYMFDPITKKDSTIYNIMMRIIREHMNLYDIYYTYQLFLRIDSSMDLDTAIEKLDEIFRLLNNSSYDFAKRIYQTLNSWSEEILNYYSNPYGAKLSNGIAEEINNQISKIISKSYGLKNFERMRKRVLFIDQNKKK